MKLGIVADIHGNVVALEAVLADAAGVGIDRWWALGDLILFGPRPVEVLDVLRNLPGIAFVRGNTDRYITSGGQPQPHATAGDASGDPDLVERYALLAAGVGWARGALSQGEALDFLDELPAQQRLHLPDGTRLLGVHASPGADDGPGIDNDSPSNRLADLFAGCDADLVAGGHTHDPTDRVVGGLRLVNGGSVGMPRRIQGAGWLVVEADGNGVRVEHRIAAFDVDSVCRDLGRRRHPNAAFVESVLRRSHPFAH